MISRKYEKWEKNESLSSKYEFSAGFMVDFSTFLLHY